MASAQRGGGDLRAQAKRPGGGYTSLVTGPSRTADIEMSLTVGVQGPERVICRRSSTNDLREKEIDQ